MVRLMLQEEMSSYEVSTRRATQLSLESALHEYVPRAAFKDLQDIFFQHLTLIQIPSDVPTHRYIPHHTVRRTQLADPHYRSFEY